MCALRSRQVPALCARMQSDAQRLTAALGTCRAAARAQRTGEVMAAMDGAYREAERCSQWRRRVQVGTGIWGQQEVMCVIASGRAPAGLRPAPAKTHQTGGRALSLVAHTQPRDILVTGKHVVQVCAALVVRLWLRIVPVRRVVAVQEFTQRCDDAGAMSAVLCATDTINQALARWQDFAGREVYEAMRITVPPMPPELLTQRAAEARSSNGSRSVNTAAAGAAANGRPAAAPPGGGKAFDIDDLLGMGSASTAGPAAAGTPAASGPHASAATSPAPWSQSNPFDPFDLGPPVAAATPAATPASGSATVAAGAALASMGSSGRPGASGSLPSTHVPTLQHPPHANPFQLAAGSAAVAAGQRPPPPQPATHTPAQTPASASTSYKVNPFDWDPFSEPLMAVQTALSSAAPIPATTASRGPLAAAGSNALPGAASGTSAAGLSSSTLHGTGSWAVFGEDMAHGSLGPVPPSPSGAAAAMSASAASFLPSPSASAASVVSTAAGGGGLPSPHSQPLHLHSGPLHGPATTPHYPTLSAGAALGSALPAGNSLQEATSNPKPPSLAQPPHAASGRQHGSALPSRQYSAPHGTTANGPNRAAAFPPSASSSDAGLDWRPGFEALSTDLRGLFAAQGGGTGGSALLPAVLSRVQALCESLAAQHVARVGTLQAAHVAEVRDVKGAALAKLREVMGAAGGHQGQSGPLQNQQQQQQQQQQQYQGVARANGGHVANGKGGGAAGAGDAISLI